MMSAFRARVVAVGLALIGVAVGRAEVPRAGGPRDETLQTVLDRIHTHAAGNAWQQPGWRDEGIEKWLETLVGSIGKAAELPHLTLPLRPQEVKAVAPPYANMIEGALMVGRDMDLASASIKNCIVLADGRVKVSRLENSIILARSAVTVSSSSKTSLIVSGIFIRIHNFDGRPDNAEQGSLLVSRGWVELDSAYGTIVVAPEGYTANRPKGAIFVNSPPTKQAVPAGRLAIVRPDRSGSRSIKAENLPLDRLPVHPLASQIEALGVEHGRRLRPGPLVGRMVEAFGPCGLVFQFEGRRLVAELDEPIVDEAGQAIAPLAGWKLIHLTSETALFAGPEADAVVPLKKK